MKKNATVWNVDWYDNGKFMATITNKEASELARGFRSPLGPARRVVATKHRLDVY